MEYKLTRERRKGCEWLTLIAHTFISPYIFVRSKDDKIS